MSKRLVIISLLVVTLLSLIGNIVANQIEPVFAGQPYVLGVVFLVLLLSTAWFSLHKETTQEDLPATKLTSTDQPVTDEIVDNQRKQDKQELALNYRLENSDVVVNYNMDCLKIPTTCSMPPYRWQERASVWSC